MKLLWYNFMQTYVKIGLLFFFKKIVINGRENIPKKKAVLFVANHQNALIDPLLVATHNPRELYFLTRAQVFKNPIIKVLLSSFNMLPIFRIRDGYDSLGKNEAIFKKCFDLLKNKKTVLIFPEGNHSLERRVRALSKGFTRIAFGTLNQYPNEEIDIIPIGFNYSNPQKYASKVHLNYGKPISVNHFFNTFDDNKAITELKDKVRQELMTLTTHIEDQENYNTIVSHFEDDEFLNPNKVNEELKTNKYQNKKTVNAQEKFNPLKFIVKINSFFPLLVWKNIKSKIPEDEYVATFKYAVGITAFPFFYILQTCIIALLFGFQIGCFYFLASFLSVFILTKTS